MKAARPPDIHDVTTVAMKLLTALAAEGRLQGEIEMRPGAAKALDADFYIEDVFTRVPGDAGVLKARLRSCRLDGGRRPRVTGAASFMWMDEEFRARFLHVLGLQPYNTQLCVQGVLSYEDVKSQSRTPLWGSIHFHPSPQRLDMALDRACAASGDTLLARHARSIRAIHHRTVRPPAFLPPLPPARTAHGQRTNNRKLSR